MQDVFYEETSVFNNVKSEKTKYYFLKVFSIIIYVLAGITLFLAFYTPLPDERRGLFILLLFIPVIIFIAIGILLGRLKFRFCLDYDYTFVTGSIRVSKVIKGIKRKLIVNFETSNIIKLGKFGSDSYNQLEEDKGNKRIILTSNSTPSDGKDFYYILASFEDGRKLLIFDCTEIFMVNVLKFSNKTVLEKDFK